MKHTKKLLILAAAVAGAVGMGAAGWAYWTAGGTGTASASVGTLAPPTILESSASGSTVSLSWSSVTAPGSDSVTYYVLRDGLAASSNCPGASTAASVTSCSDLNVPGDTYEYTVTAVYRTWTATSLPASVTVTPFGPLHHFRVTVPGGLTAGTPFNATITAQDADDRTVLSYTGSQTIAFTGPDTAPDGTAPQLPSTATFTDGVGNASVTLYRAESPTLTVAQGGIAGSSGNFVVFPAGAADLSVSSGTTQTAGTAFDVTVTANDSYGNQATGYTGAVRFTSSDSQAILPSDYTFIGGDGGTHVFSATLKTGGAQSIIATDMVTASITGMRAGITVEAAGAAKFVITSSALSAAASSTANLGPITVQQQDQFGNPTTTAKTIVLSSSTSGTAVFSATQNGTATTSVNIPGGSSSTNFYYGDTKAGTPTITAHTSGLTDATQQETITASKLAITTTAVSGAASTSAALGPITVQLQDASGSPVNAGAGGTAVTLTSNSTGTSIFSATSGGTGVTSVAVPTGSSSASFYYADTKAGTPTITAQTSGLTDATQQETINGAAPATLQLANCVVQGSPQACDGSYKLGNSLTMVANVRAIDEFGNAATISSALSLAVTSGNTTTYSITAGATLTINGTATPQNQSTGTFTVKKSSNASNSTTIRVRAGGSIPDLTFTVVK